MPAGAGAVATAEDFATGNGGSANVAIIYPQSPTSVAVVMMNAGTTNGDAAGEFAWIAVP